VRAAPQVLSRVKAKLSFDINVLWVHCGQRTGAGPDLRRQPSSAGFP
jgi:hypothetical protein